MLYPATLSYLYLPLLFHSCVDFVINLHKVHDIPLALAYSTGISQYHSLKASYEIALYSAQSELLAHGFEWPTEFSTIDRRARAEERNIIESVRAHSKANHNATGDAAAGAGGAPRASLLEPVPTPAQFKTWTGGLQYLTGKESPAFNGGNRQTTPANTSGTGFGHIER